MRSLLCLALYLAVDPIHQRRLNSIGVLAGDLPVGANPKLPTTGWQDVFFQRGYLGVVKRIELDIVATQVAVYSNATKASNLDEGGNSEPGILAISEVEVYGMPLGK